jgi:hypothetical protein
VCARAFLHRLAPTDELQKPIMAKGFDPWAAEEPDHSQGPDWLFWTALLAPLLMGFLLEFIGQLGSDYRPGLGLALFLLALILACSAYCAARIGARCCENSSLRVFVTTGLLLLLAIGYLLFLFFVHLLTAGVDASW